MRIAILILYITLSKSIFSQQLKKYSPLYIKDILEINTGQTSPLKLAVHENVKINNVNYLKISDKKNKNILLYNFSTKKYDTIYVSILWSEIAWFGEISSAIILDSNRIFVGKKFNELLQINKNGQIINKWKFREKNKFDNDFYLVFNDLNIKIINDSTFYFVQYLFLNDDSFSNRKKIYSINNIVYATLDNNRNINVIKTFGPFYKNAEQYHSHLLIAPDIEYNKKDSLLIMYFNKHDTIYIYKNNFLIQKADVSSRFKTEYLKYDYDKEKDDYLFFEKYLVEEPLISQVLWDEYRNLYFVVYKHRQNYKENDGRVNELMDADISIIILNNKFEKINEIVLKNDYKFNRNILVLKEGLAIDFNHEFQPHIKENKLKFLILDIDKYVK
jgi:hypothetical protein